jgi:hypothetical protein
MISFALKFVRSPKKFNVPKRVFCPRLFSNLGCVSVRKIRLQFLALICIQITICCFLKFSPIIDFVVALLLYSLIWNEKLAEYISLFVSTIYKALNKIEVFTLKIVRKTNTFIALLLFKKNIVFLTEDVR